MKHPKDDEDHILVGESWVRRSNLERLHEAWEKRRLVLCLGAGVSTPYGLPNWKELILGLLLRIKARDRNGREVTWNTDYPAYQRALGTWMMEHFGFDPLRLSRVFQKRPKLRDTLRTELYASFAEPRRQDNKPTSLDGIVELIVESNRASRTLPAVITLNYDDLLEDSLRAAGIRCCAIYDGNQKIGGGLPIYHLHGYLPRKVSIPNQDIIFTEPAYHERSSATFHWSVKRIMRHLHSHSILFVGVSMADTNLRRFLDACRLDDDRPHFSILKNYEINDTEFKEEMTSVHKHAKEYAHKMGRDACNKPTVNELKKVMRDACSTAHNCEWSALATLGIHPVWVSNYDDVPRVLAKIRKGLQN